MSLLKTSTEKEYLCNFMGVASGSSALYIQISIDLHEALTVFQNPEETKTLQWIGDNGEIVREETGYTFFTGFSIVPGECPVRIRMQKPYII